MLRHSRSLSRSRGRSSSSPPAPGSRVYPIDSGNVESLLRNADIAMYHAKDNGRNNLQFYTPDMNALKRERMTLESQLRRAIDRGELYLEYQPQVASNRHAFGVEALVRWQHPELGFVSADRFIPLAEKSALILAHRRMGPAHRVCAGDGVALAGRAAGEDLGECFAEAVPIRPLPDRRRCLHETGLPAASLELELTESLLMDEPEAARVILDKLKALGRAHRHRRLRIRLFEPQLSQAFSDRLPEDRPELRPRSRERSERRRHRETRRRPVRP